MPLECFFCSVALKVKIFTTTYQNSSKNTVVDSSFKLKRPHYMAAHLGVCVYSFPTGIRVMAVVVVGTTT